MNRTDYLSAVEPFVDWFSARLDDHAFAHARRVRESGTTWSCESLTDALERYRRPHPALPRIGVPAGDSFASNMRALAVLRQNLLDALRPAGRDEQVRDACLDVIEWGGFADGDADIDWLHTSTNGLKQRLIDTRDALDSDDPWHPRLCDASLRFTAGISKVHSLIADDLIVYDSRAAAALGLAVVRFHRQTRRPSTLEALLFPCLPAHRSPDAGEAKRRDASVAGIRFPTLQTPTHHARWNRRASWLLRAVLDHPNARHSGFRRFVSPSQRLRALEAALFMVGDDLGDAALPLPVEHRLGQQNDQQHVREHAEMQAP